MGSYTELTVAGYPLVTSKSAVIPEVMTIFREGDRRVVERRLSELNPLVWGSHTGEDETEIAYEYACSARIAIARLNVMGFTLERARREFESGAEAERRGLDDYGDSSEWATNWVGERRQCLNAMTFETYLEALRQIINSGLRPNPFEDSKKPGLDPLVAFVLNEDEDHPFGYFGGDVRLLIRIACDLVDEEPPVVQDITSLVAGGYYGENEPVCDGACQALTADHPANASRIILTEGASDCAVLRDALTLLYPHLAEYYSFIDFESARAPGGAAQLVAVVKAFAATGITNRVIALFDNDTAARDAARSLAPVVLPANIAVLHYPPLESLRQYPTVGPTGPAVLDVNDLAGSIELYLGDDVLRGKSGQLPPVHWRGYVDGLRHYQGEVAGKQGIQARFREKVDRCRANPQDIAASDWSGLHAILNAVFKAFERKHRSP